jgi:hypothetical protein
MPLIWILALIAVAVGFVIGRLVTSRLVPTIYLLVGTVALGLLALRSVEEQPVAPEDQTGLAVLFWGIIWVIVVAAPTFGALLGNSLRQRR